MKFALMCLGALVACIAAACGDDDGVSDAGRDTAVPVDSGGDGGGFDSAVDATDASMSSDSAVDASGDAVADSTVDTSGDAGPEVRQSRISALLAGGVTTLPVFDGSGAPLHLDGIVAFDSGSIGEDVYATVGDQLYHLTGFATDRLTFTEARTLVDGAGAALDPDVLFSGSIGAAETIVGVFGSQARVLNFASATFDVGVDLLKTDDSPLTPISATFVNLGSGTATVAVEAGDATLFTLDGAGRFASGPSISLCSAPTTTIVAEQILSAAIPGIAPAGLPDAVVAIRGSDAYVLESIAPSVCFGPAVPLVDESGASIAPELAVGWDYDDNTVDDVLLVDSVVL